MIYRPELLDLLEQLPASPWSGRVFRHMFARLPPQRENIKGARWNPEGFPAIYTSLEVETALAEVAYRLSLEPYPPSKGRVLYHLDVTVSNVADLRGPGILESLGITPAVLSDPLSLRQCQEIGAAAGFSGYTGLLVPSVRRTPGSNLVILAYDQFDVVDQQDIDPSDRA